MKVVVTGARGLIGSALVPALLAGGHSVSRLTRGEPREEGEYRWDPAAGQIDPAALEGVDAGVHLAGESVGGRWTSAKKERILRSRVDGTRTLSESLATLQPAPSVLVCASAVGYYGDRGDELLTEESGPGEGFLADVVRHWEEASSPAEEAGIRVVRLRLGIVLSSAGGALKSMLPAFRLGIAGRLGSGRQHMSWISIDDAVAAYRHALETVSLRGAANATSPNPVTNEEFTKTLGRVLRRPTLLPVPALALRIVFGEFAEQGLLSSARVVPRRLEQSGFEFRHPELEQALRHVLGR
jgi:uncharacterized protein